MDEDDGVDYEYKQQSKATFVNKTNADIEYVVLDLIFRKDQRYPKIQMDGKISTKNEIPMGKLRGFKIKKSLRFRRDQKLNYSLSSTPLMSLKINLYGLFIKVFMTVPLKRYQKSGATTKIVLNN